MPAGRVRVRLVRLRRGEGLQQRESQQQQFGDRGQHAYGDDRVTVMKSKVLYHSRADFRSSTESSSIEWSSDQEAAL